MRTPATRRMRRVGRPHMCGLQAGPHAARPTTVHARWSYDGHPAFWPSEHLLLNATSYRPDTPRRSPQPAIQPAQSSKDSSCMRERKRRTAFVCICETRDSVTPSTSPISRRVRFS
jgi:hypothetical protein